GSRRRLDSVPIGKIWIPKASDNAGKTRTKIDHSEKVISDRKGKDQEDLSTQAKTSDYVEGKTEAPVKTDIETKVKTKVGDKAGVKARGKRKPQTS
ncbi:MAG: hypothetical protein AAB306_01730, partial [Pseudomonadota bacterium]